MTPPSVDELELIRTQAKRVERHARILKQQVAKALAKAADEQSTAEEAHDDRDRHTRN